jgi:hypothetical protein
MESIDTRGILAFMGSIVGLVALIKRGKIDSREYGTGETEQKKAYEALIGNTPMVKLYTASTITGCNIYVKVGYLRKM